VHIVHISSNKINFNKSIYLYIILPWRHVPDLQVSYAPDSRQQIGKQQIKPYIVLEKKKIWLMSLYSCCSLKYSWFLAASVWWLGSQSGMELEAAVWHRWNGRHHGRSAPTQIQELIFLMEIMSSEFLFKLRNARSVKKLRSSTYWFTEIIVALWQRTIKMKPAFRHYIDS
jgi:hypothetical protein